MENHASNPAGRLWMYFDEMTQGAGDQPVSLYAQTYFGAGEIDDRYMIAMAELMRLPSQVEAMVSQLEHPPIPEAKLLRPLPKVRAVFQNDPLAKQPVKWLTRMIDAGSLSDLETTSHILSSSVTRITVIPTDTLSDIKALAQEIVALAMADEELDAEARAAVMRFANHIVSAADLYTVTGPQGLIDELDRFYSQQRRSKAEPSAPLKVKLGQLVGAIVLAVDLFAAPATMANAIEFYGEMFAITAAVEAPAGSLGDDIVVAEVVEVRDDDEITT